MLLARMLVVPGRVLVALHDWTFRLGPGFVVGIGNAILPGYLLWKTRLVPRAMSLLGLVGGSVTQIVVTIPEFFRELSLGIWMLVKGFNRTALAMPIEPAR